MIPSDEALKVFEALTDRFISTRNINGCGTRLIYTLETVATELGLSEAQEFLDGLGVSSFDEANDQYNELERKAEELKEEVDRLREENERLEELVRLTRVTPANASR